MTVGAGQIFKGAHEWGGKSNFLGGKLMITSTNMHNNLHNIWSNISVLALKTALESSLTHWTIHKLLRGTWYDGTNCHENPCKKPGYYGNVEYP